MSTCTFSNKSLSVKICQYLFKLCLKDIIYLSLILNTGITTWKYFLTVENIWPLPAILAMDLKYFQFAVLPFGLSTAPYLF